VLGQRRYVGILKYTPEYRVFRDPVSAVAGVACLVATMPKMRLHHLHPIPCLKPLLGPQRPRLQPAISCRPIGANR
jgi:hypothetical protein